jgi:hypothetical protein
MSKYVVIDEDGNVSYSAARDEPECFDDFPTAEVRARELARCAPGEVINIFKLNASVVAPVGEIEVKRRDSE